VTISGLLKLEEVGSHLLTSTKTYL
jgi:hypothetical protein